MFTGEVKKHGGLEDALSWITRLGFDQALVAQASAGVKPLKQ